MQGKRADEEACSHNVYIKGLCGNCGIRLDPPQSTSVSMIHSVPELKVSEEYAKEIGKADQERLIQERKLVLLVDLDQTILHTTHEVVENDPHVHSFQLWPGHPTYFTKLRPHLKDFLEQMSTLYELHIFTFGNRMYAHKIASIIDPEQKYFGNRILSRDESVDQYSKRGNLNNLFPCGDAMVCIIDDRADVWRDAGNLIQVKPYSYFKTSISDGAFVRMSARSSKEEEEALERDADKLQALLGVDDDLSGDENGDDDDEDNDEEGSTSSSESSGNSSSPAPSEILSDETESREALDRSDGVKRKEPQSDGMGATSDESDEVRSERREAEPAEPAEPTEPGQEQEEAEERAGKRLKPDEAASGASVSVVDSEASGTGRSGELGPAAAESRAGTEAEAAARVGVPAEQGPGRGDEGQAPASGESADSDDHLLKLQTILSRVHEKWYLELDEQRQFLEAGENYKLPDIKDIISRYLRKSYR